MRETKNTALLDAYLDKFSDGEFVILARARIAELRSQANRDSHPGTAGGETGLQPAPALTRRGARRRGVDILTLAFSISSSA